MVSRIFEKWLRRVNCRLLLVDCWYGREQMAASLAATRLGIPTVDLQHGSYGHTYSAWTRAPKEGYEVFPDAFWGWGEESKGILLQANPILGSPDSVIVGGNLWINKWRQLQDQDLIGQVELTRNLANGYRKAILVTLQSGINLDNILLETIQQSPKDWLWLIRPHRRDWSQPKKLEEKYMQLNHPGVNLLDALQHPLYALFHGVHIHLTGYSTCALEALAFGLPTVLLHPMAKMIYSGSLDRKVMLYAEDAHRALEEIGSCESIKAEDCTKAANSTFALPENSDRAINKLLTLAGL